MVGGLLSAYDLSEDKVFLGRAQELVELMLPAMGSDDVGTGAPSDIGSSLVLTLQCRQLLAPQSKAACGVLTVRHEMHVWHSEKHAYVRRIGQG